MSSRSREQLEEWLKGIDDFQGNESVLDIGGSQSPIWARVKNLNESNVDILDLPVPHEKKSMKARILHDINYPLGRKVRRRYDAVFMIEVFEYVWDMKTAFENCRTLLRKGGRLYFSTHWLYGLHNPENKVMTALTTDGALKLCSESGFSVKECLPRTIREDSREHLKKFYKQERMRVRYDDEMTYVEGGLFIAERL